MKRVFTSLALTLMTIASAWANHSAVTSAGVTTETWDFGEYTTAIACSNDVKQVEYEGLLCYFGTNDGKDQVGSSSGFKCNGAAGSNKRYIKFTPAYEGTITVYYISNSSSATDRVVAVGTSVKTGASLTDGADGVVAHGNTNGYTEQNFSGSLNAGTTYYIYNANGGCAIKKIVYTYNAAPKTKTAVNAEASGLTTVLDNGGTISSDGNSQTFAAPISIVGDKAIQTGNAQYQFTVGSKNYIAAKFSNNGTYVVTPAAGVTITSVKAYGSSNNDNTSSIVSGDNSQDLATRGAKNSPVTATAFTLAKNDEGNFYFKISGNQSIVVLEVTYDRAENLDVTLSNAGYATLFYDKNLAIPAGITAYTAALNDAKDKLVLTEVADVIPASTAVILEGAEGSYNFTVTPADAPTVGSNVLAGTATDKDVTANSVYTLGQDSESVVGMRLYSGTSLRAYSAYLDASAVSGARQLTLVFADADVTAIKTVSTAARQTVRKYVQNGRLVIKAADGTYSIAGTQLR